MNGEQKPGGLEGEGVSATYRFAYESIRKGAPGLSDTTCMAIARSINMKVSIAAEPAEARIRELERDVVRLGDGLRQASVNLDAAEAKLARAVEGLETIRDNKTLVVKVNDAREVARQTLAALQQEGE